MRQLEAYGSIAMDLIMSNLSALNDPNILVTGQYIAEFHIFLDPAQLRHLWLLSRNLMGSV